VVGVYKARAEAAEAAAAEAKAEAMAAAAADAPTSSAASVKPRPQIAGGVVNDSGGGGDGSGNNGDGAAKDAKIADLESKLGRAKEVHTRNIGPQLSRFLRMRTGCVYCACSVGLPCFMNALHACRACRALFCGLTTCLV